MVQQPTQKDIDELMKALGGSYKRDEIVQVARDLDMLPPEKPQVVLGDMVTHPLPPPVEEVPVLEEAVQTASGAQENTIPYEDMLRPEAPAQQSRWQKLKGLAGSAAKYVGKAVANGTVAGAKKGRDAYQRQSPRRKKIILGVAAAGLGALAAYVFVSFKNDVPVVDKKTVFATLSYNGTDWAIPKDAAKQVEEFMDGSFVKGDTFQTIEQKLINADLADKVKDNKIYAAGLKYLK